MDASGVTYVHNLALGYKGGSIAVYGSTGRICGASSLTTVQRAPGDSYAGGLRVMGSTCAISNWTMAGNLLLGSARVPWVKMHCDKHGSHGEDLVDHDILSNNLVRGTNPDFSRDQDKSKCSKPTGVELENNHNVSAQFVVELDIERMTLSLTADATIGTSGCTPGGPGGDIDFTGAKRSSTKCSAGPVEGLTAGKTQTISLIPTNGVAPPIPPPPSPPPPSPLPPSPPGCNASAFRSNVIFGDGSTIGPTTATRTPMLCCARCQANSACGCCESCITISAACTHNCQPRSSKALFQCECPKTVCCLMQGRGGLEITSA
eukprot:SAG31_NODE_3784_length_3883_cov_1.859672_2_plen_319_part_00